MIRKLTAPNEAGNYINKFVKKLQAVKKFDPDYTYGLLDKVYSDGFEDGVNEAQKENDSLKIQLDTCAAICDIWSLPSEDLKYLTKYFKDMDKQLK